ncbi:MAG: lysophospholipid acyltransferase family protein [Candidatus Omnitrophota bacterium]|nr:lysophospholipid acyltransferase family protein [Candidatus Omnitrophota bacterium]
MIPPYAGWRVSQWLGQWAPLSVLYQFAESMADRQWLASTKDRQAVQANLTLALGVPVPECSPVVREVFRNFARYLVEFFSLHRVQTQAVEMEGLRYLHEAHRQGRGVIVLTAHFGNWELAAVIVRRLGFTLRAVALPHADPRTDRVFNEQRRRCGIEVIPLGPAAMHQSFHCLREGHLLGVLGDQPFTGHGVPARLCGRTVTLPSGPSLLSLRSQAPIVPTFLVREGAGKFRLCFEPPMWPQTHPAGRPAFSQLTQRWAMILQQYLTRFPSQWLLLQPIEGLASGI